MAFPFATSQRVIKIVRQLKVVKISVMTHPGTKTKRTQNAQLSFVEIYVVVADRRHE